MTIIINDYNPLWPQQFEAIRSSLQQILGATALRIDHIGSTSVPGLGTKDVIDIQIMVQELSPEVRQGLFDGACHNSPSHDRRSRVVGQPGSTPAVG